MADDTSASDTLTLTAEIVSAYLGNATHVSAADIPNIIKNVRAALDEVDAPTEAPAETGSPKLTKAQIRKSITPDALISFIDGKSYKTLKRHLAGHGMDLKAYRAAYGLPDDYPSVAPAYSAARSEMARTLGLGGRGRGAKAAEAPPAAQQPAKPPRAKKAVAEPAEG